ncbi:hypothetical protein Hanom_Chr12g01166131 [Helianthus anomalus]
MCDLFIPILISKTHQNVNLWNPFIHRPVMHIHRDNTSTDIEEFLLPIVQTLQRNGTDRSNTRPRVKRVKTTGVCHSIKNVKHLKCRINTIGPADKFKVSNTRKPNRVNLRNMEPIVPQHRSSKLGNRKPEVAIPEKRSIQSQEARRCIHGSRTSSWIPGSPSRTKAHLPHQIEELVFLPPNHCLVRTRRSFPFISPLLLGRIRPRHNEENHKLKENTQRKEGEKMKKWERTKLQNLKSEEEGETT